MSQIMGLPADKLLEDYTPGEKMAYTYNSGYQAAIADALGIINDELATHIRMKLEIPNTYGAKSDKTEYVTGRIRERISALLEDKS